MIPPRAAARSFSEARRLSEILGKYFELRRLDNPTQAPPEVIEFANNFSKNYSVGTDAPFSFFSACIDSLKVGLCLLVGKMGLSRDASLQQA